MGDDGSGGLNDSGFSDSGFSDASFGGFGDAGLADAGFADSSFGGFGDAGLADAGFADSSFGGFGDAGFNDSSLGFNQDDEAGFAPFQEDETNSFTQALMGFLSGKAQNAVMGALGIPSMAANIMGLANQATKGPEAAGKGFGSIAGGMLGSAFGGPLGGALGAALGGSFGSSALGGVTGAGQGMGPSSIGGDILQGLAGLYMGNRLAGQYNSAMGDLNGLFTANSPYAQQMRQELERRDAAAGRRSQYGNRETELAAKLAQLQANTLTSAGYQNMLKQRGTAQNQGLNTVLALLSKSGLGDRLGNMARAGLGSIFGGVNNTPQLPNDFDFGTTNMRTGIDFNQPSNNSDNGFSLGDLWGM